MNKTNVNKPYQKRAAIYTRVSTQQQVEHGHSLAAQEKEITERCIRDGCTIYKVYSDQGITGTSMKRRPQLQAMLQDAKNGMFDVLYVYKSSRLARSTKDLLTIIETLSDLNIDYVQTNGDVDTSTPSGKMVLTLMGSFDEFERDNMVENINAGLVQRAQSGLTNGASLLGYDKSSKPNQPIVVNKVEAEIIKLIYDLYERGHGFRYIADKLNKDGYSTKRDNPFSIVAVKDILKNPTYKGYVQFQKYVDWNKKRRKGKNMNPIIVKGQHEAIISEKQWDKVAQQLIRRSYTPQHLGDGSNLLTGILRCPQCKGAMAASNTTNTLKSGEKKRIRYYSCATFRNKGAAVCSANSVRADDIEERVAKRIISLINQPQVLRDTVDASNKELENKLKSQYSSIPTLKEEIEVLQSKNAELNKIMLENPDLSIHLKETIDNNTKSIEGIFHKINDIRDSETDSIPIEYDTDSLKQVLDSISKIILSGSSMDIKQMYLASIEKITFKKNGPRKLGTVTIELKPGIASKLINQNEHADDPNGSSFLMGINSGILLHCPSV